MNLDVLTPPGETSSLHFTLLGRYIKEGGWMTNRGIYSPAIMKYVLPILDHTDRLSRTTSSVLALEAGRFISTW